MEPKPLTDEEIKTIGLMDGGVSIFTVRRLLATLAARDAEIERLRSEIASLTIRSYHKQRVAND